MKKKVIAGLLAVVFAATIIQTGVSKVAAEPDEALEAEETLTPADMEETENQEDPSDLTEETSEDMKETGSEEETDPEEESLDTEEAAEKEIQGMKITLENTLGEAIVSVQVKSFFADAYSENLLPESKHLEAGSMQTLGVPTEFQDREFGLYDVRITKENGTVTDIPLVPLLEEITGSLYVEDGITLIRIRDARLEAEAEAISEAEMIQREAEASQTMAEALAEELE